MSELSLFPEIEPGIQVKGLPVIITGETKFSPCRTWRYELWRRWNPVKGYVQFIGLNPSKADEIRNDPTLVRCIKFAYDWGFGGMVMTNIFGYRSTDPDVLSDLEDPVGPENDETLLRAAQNAAVIVVAWSGEKVAKGRYPAVVKLLDGFQLTCLGVTEDGSPRHPLYTLKSSKPLPWKEPKA